MKKLILTISLISVSGMLFAQTPAIVNTLSTPAFFISVIAGLVIALGFQFLLTALSVATGVSAIGNLKEAYAKSKHRVDHSSDDDDNNTSTLKKVISGVGIWNTVTTSIALFGATSVALMLSPVDVAGVKIALALCIWAAFFLTIFFLEINATASMIGGLVQTALSGLKNSGQAVAGLFTNSTEEKIYNKIDDTVEKIRAELNVEVNTDQLSETLDKHLSKLGKRAPSYEKLKSDLMEIASEGGSSGSPAKWTAIQGVINKAIDSNSSSDSKGKGKIEQLKEMVMEIRQAIDESDSSTEAIRKGLKATPIADENADQIADKIEDVISESSNGTFRKENLKSKLNDILNNGGNTITQIRKSVDKLDKERIKDILDNKTDVDREKIDTYVDQAYEILNTVKEKVGITNNDPFTPNVLESIEHKIRTFIESTDNDELDYNLLKNDLMKMWSSPKESLKIIKNRLQTFDKDTVVSLVTNTPYVDRVDIEKLSANIESTRNDVLAKIDDIEKAAAQKVKQVERKAVAKAEYTRKIAASAAWWVVASTIISAVAAIGGGLLSL